MKSFLSIMFLILWLPNHVFSQNKTTNNSGLQVSWKLIGNHNQNKSRALTQFTISNTGNEIFNNEGWAIYFCYNREILPFETAQPVTIKHINGDIFEMRPSKSFKKLRKGESEIISFYADGEVLNKSSAPLGLYLVWDQQPDKGIPVDYEISPLSDSSIAYVTDENIFKRNEFIKNIPLNQLPKVFPAPVSYEEKSGSFQLSLATSFDFDPAFTNEVSFFKKELEKLLLTEKKLNGAARTKVIFRKAEMANEAYLLEVSDSQIIITAATGAGAFYAIQSLLSAIPPDSWSKKQNSVSIPIINVKDEPRFGYRSLSLDIARNFRSKKELLKILDLISMYKMNVLHLHFSDDEGWRIEIPSLPELTQFGAQRGHPLNSENFLPASFASGPATGKAPGSGFYTEADFIEILKYATERHIEVIPEIESPGHSRAAIKAMDFRYKNLVSKGKTDQANQFLLSDANDRSIYSSAQLWTDNVICAALPSTYRFIEKVVDDLSKMYKAAGAPLKTIHMGGDEVPAGAWENSPACKQLVMDKGLASTDELWFYFYTQVNDILKKKGLFMSGWEEMAMRKTKLDGEHKMIVNPAFFDQNIQIHVWNNMIGWGSEDLPYRLANAGYKVVLSPVSNNYFDMAYFKHPEEPGYYWGGFQDIEKPFQFIPFDYYKSTAEDAAGNPINHSYFIGKDRLTDYGKKNIVGIEGLIWSETLHTDQNLEYMILPKLMGLAQRAWSPDPDWSIEKDTTKSSTMYHADLSTFLNVIAKRILPKLDVYNGGYAYRIPTVGVKTAENLITLNVQLPGLTVRYTTDGTRPTIKSKIYNNQPIPNNGQVKVSVFNTTGRAGRCITIDKK